VTNPFDAGSADGGAPQPPGTLDLGLALRDGVDAMVRNFLPWLGVLGLTVLLFLGTVGACVAPGALLLARDGVELLPVAVLLVGIVVGLLIALFLAPPLTWGTTRFALDSLDGRAEVATVYRPFSHLGATLLPMLGVLVLLMLVNVVGSVVSTIVQSIVLLPGLVGDEDAMLAFTIASNVVGGLLSVAWACVIGARVGFAPQYLVDQGLSPADAVTASWRASGDAKIAVAVFQIVVLGLMLIGVLACVVGTIPAMMVVSGAHASAYRQLAGRHAAR
jgi:hypothetical protein